MVLLAVVGAVVLLVTRSPAFAATAHLLAGGTALVALPVGVWLHRPRTMTPWVLFGMALLAFIVSEVLREASIDATAAVPLAGVSAGIPDLFAYIGYGLLVTTGLGMLRATGAQRDGGASADGATLMIAASLLSWAYLISPTFGPSLSHRDLSTRVVMASYPVLDTVLLFLMSRVALAMQSRGPSLLFVMQAYGCLLAGDTAFGLIEAGAGIPLAVVDALYLLAYAGLAASALHPSMRALTAPQPLRATSLRHSRLVVVAISMLIPAGLIIVQPPDSLADRLILACGLVAITMTALWRTSTAVNGQARETAAMAHAALHDALTGLPNRTSVVQHTTLALARRGGDQHVAVVYMDLDGLKWVNDKWGRGAGDELIASVAARLRATARSGDIVARVGGDEFVVICEGTDPLALAAVMSERILDVVSDTFTLRDGRAQVTASVGLVHTRGRHDVVSAEGLLRDAETAMHQARTQGHNQTVTFDQWMLERSTDRIELQLALRDAVSTAAISVAYQPLVELHTGRLLGFEALARWDRPGVGLVSPVEFIPIAEESGLIVPLGAAVLSTAMAQLARWRAEAPHDDRLHMSVNVAARQLADPAFADLVASALAAHDLPGHALWLEITESVIVDDDLPTLQTLQRLHGLGVTLALDDFGTGYSSLNYLKRFPVGVLKIDRSFVAELGVHPSAEVLPAAIIAMARALDLLVVAEGVETELQRDLLHALGCQMAQGWLYGRPVAAEHASVVVATARAAALA